MSEECIYEENALNSAVVECTFSTLRSLMSVTIIVVESETSDSGFHDGGLGSCHWRPVLLILISSSRMPFDLVACLRLDKKE